MLTQDGKVTNKYSLDAELCRPIFHDTGVLSFIAEHIQVKEIRLIEAPRVFGRSFPEIRYRLNWPQEEEVWVPEEELFSTREEAVSYGIARMEEHIRQIQISIEYWRKNGPSSSKTVKR